MHLATSLADRDCRGPFSTLAFSLARLLLSGPILVEKAVKDLRVRVCAFHLITLWLSVLEQWDRRRVDKVRLGCGRTFSEDQVCIRMSRTIHPTLVRGGGQGSTSAVVRHRGHLRATTLPADLVAAVSWHESH